MDIAKGHSFTIPLEEMPSVAKPLHMIWVDPGMFVMGSPQSEPGYSKTEKQFTVTLNHGFWLGEVAVTQAHWDAVIKGEQPSNQDKLNYPVGNVDWDQATSFCQALDDKYRYVLPTNYSFGLPTEAQWEYACRAGSQTMFYNGNDPNCINEIAWNSENSEGRIHPVGEKEPNKWGFYDMLGNMIEWCFDSTTEYPDHHVQDWYGKPQYPTRSARGGAFGHSAMKGMLRCATRFYILHDTKYPHIGFRLCLRTLGSVDI